MQKTNTLTIVVPAASLGNACLMFGILIELAVIAALPPGAPALLACAAGLALAISGAACVWISHYEPEPLSCDTDLQPGSKPLPECRPQTLLRSGRRRPEVDPEWENAL